MSASGIFWQRPPSALAADIEAYGRRVLAGVLAVGQLIAQRLEANAKANAPWTDRTTQARNGLTGLAMQAAGDLVRIYLYHKAAHGKWLEIARGGPYRIIMPTINAMLGEIWSLLARIFQG